MKIYFFSVLANLLSCFVFSGTRPTCAPARALLLWGLRLLVNDMRIIAPLFVVASGLITLVCTTSMSRVDKASGEGLAPNVETTAQGETADTYILLGILCFVFAMRGYTRDIALL